MSVRDAWTWQDFLAVAPGWRLDHRGRPVPPSDTGAAGNPPVLACVAASASAPVSGRLPELTAGANVPAPAAFSDPAESQQLRRARELLAQGCARHLVLQAVRQAPAELAQLDETGGVA